MEIVFLGTSSMVPTSNRNHSSIFLRYKEENILIDCGEGTQRQIRKAGISPSKLTKILISHWHGDHVLGLPGLMQTLIANKFSKNLKVYGPKGTKKYFDKMMEAFIIRGNMLKLKITEIDSEKFFENEDFVLESYKLEHGVCLGFNLIEKDKRKIDINKLKKFGLKSHPILKELQRGKDINWNGKKIKAKDVTFIVKGKKISFVSDTKKCENILRMCKNADLMICESTLKDDLKHIAEERDHLTSVQAAELAKKAKVKRLILTHFSQRYNDVTLLIKEARKIFKDVIEAKDFLRIQI